MPSVPARHLFGRGLHAGLRLAVVADEADEVAGDGAVGVGAAGVALAVDPGDVEGLDLLPGGQVDHLLHVGEVGLRIVGEGMRR